MNEYDNSPYMSPEDMKELDRLLTYKDCLKETMSCWKATRINGASASLACEGNVSIEVLKAFDNIRDMLDNNRIKESE